MLHARPLLFTMFLSLLGPLPLHAATGDTVTLEGQGTIIIEQRPAEGFDTIFGSWTLLKPDHTREEWAVSTMTFETAPAGNYLITFQSPSGMAGQIALNVNGTETIIDQPQTSFVLHNGDRVTAAVLYRLSRYGKVSVESDPPSLGFLLKGPDNAQYQGTTPAAYDAMPEGLYSVIFDEIPGCITPKPQSGRLVDKSRVSLSLTVACEALEHTLIQKTEDRTFKYVTVEMFGQQVTFLDVPMDTWYAPFVANAVKAGVMTGYRAADGNPTGSFGPGDNVTIDQLAKVAHTLANIDVSEVTGTPENRRARESWAAPFFISAEQLNWLVFQNRSVDPERPATRGEVIATLLQALNIPVNWPTGKLFSDVTRFTPYAGTIETAAAQGLVTGYTNEKGDATGTFGPENPVNRAELTKILKSAADIYINTSESFQPEG
ncbi:MAG: S-layer homology domain-containing protein [Candidatus Peribacteraceae bacterium]|nr:S-layer homology domain-containing protein [Candidatus Peribacteraceae bacterium]